MQIYNIYTDGSCAPNPGIGGWAYVIIDQNENIVKQESGKVLDTTNNRMELQAVINALKHCYKNLKFNYLIIYTDSALITKWNQYGKGRKNRDLIIKLNKLNSNLIKFQWIKGHNKNKWNDFVDKEANLARTNTVVYNNT